MLTQAETVTRMTKPITTAGLSQIESGKVRPSAPTIQDLALALDVPTAFFFSEWSGTDDVLALVPYFRDLAATPAKQRRRAGAMALILSDLLGAIDQHVRLPDLSVPGFPTRTSASRAEIEDVAQAVRGEWGLQDEPVSNVVRVLEGHGVAVARLFLGVPTVDAFSVLLKRRPLLILASDKTNYVRSRFDAAHELGHLVMHVHADSGERRLEQQANHFASSFLFPEQVATEVLPRRVDAAGWAKLAELKRDWGISIAALLFRSHDLGVLSTDRYRNAMKYMSARGWRTNEPGDRQMGSPEAPRLIETAMRMIEAEYQLSPEQFASAASLPITDTLELIAAATDRRPRLVV